MYVVREGYEGLVRGNIEGPKRKVTFDEDVRKQQAEEEVEDKLINNLRFGDGNLLKEGEGDAMDGVDHPGGRSLKGRYIIRVGWDDVRAWFSEVCTRRTTCILCTNVLIELLGIICREVH